MSLESSSEEEQDGDLEDEELGSESGFEEDQEDTDLDDDELGFESESEEEQDVIDLMVERVGLGYNLSGSNIVMLR